MATYVIGDLHGCAHSLEALLSRIGLRPEDRLWFLGDLVNRGRHSLAVLRLLTELEAEVRSVLGNHDLRLIRMLLAGSLSDERGYLDELFSAPDRDQLVSWLRRQPLTIAEGNWRLVHAGLLPGWDEAEIERRAAAAERLIRGEQAFVLLELQRGALTLPHADHENSSEMLEAARTIAVLTRLRCTDSEGHPVGSYDGPPSLAPQGELPWYSTALGVRWSRRVLFGHWSQLGLMLGARAIGLDTSCVRGGGLTAIRLEDQELIRVGTDPRDKT